MASFNMTVEDSSPMITYAPAGSWIDTPSSDPLATSYSGGSYHVASSQGATATITFTGTGFSIYGGHRSDYGTYSISVDGQMISSGNAQAGDAATQQLLGGVTDLAYGSHTAVLTNTGGDSIDIDRIDFVTQVGTQPGAVGVRKTLDDNDPTITYSPSSGWQTNTGSTFFDETLHYSQVQGASASITFSGDAVAVWGTVSPDHANINMNLDGNSQIIPGGAGGMASVVHPQVLLYYHAGLGPGQHTLTMSGDSQSTTGPFIDLDMINVFDVATSDNSSPTVSTASIPAATLSTISQSSVPTTTLEPSSSFGDKTDISGTGKSGLSKGAIAGVVVGLLLGIALLISLLGFMFLRRRKRRAREIEKSMIAVSPVLPMQGDPRALESGMRLENPVFPLPPTRPQPASLNRSPSRHSIAPSYYSDPSEYSGHSRGGSTMSGQSTAALFPPVPIIDKPLPRFTSIRKPAPARSGSTRGGNPVRPSNRPPTMNFMIMED